MLVGFVITNIFNFYFDASVIMQFVQVSAAERPSVVIERGENMIEYTSGKRTESELRKIILPLIKRAKETKADELRRKILKQKITDALAK